MKPERMAFQASSFCRQLLIAQSKVENIPPQTPKLPPVTGARAFIEETAPARRSPCGEWWAGRGTEKPTYTGRIAGALDAVPDAATDGTHGEGTPKVVEDYPRAVIVSRVDGGEEETHQGSRVWSAWAIARVETFGASEMAVRHVRLAREAAHCWPWGLGCSAQWSG